jgi:alpha-amylase
MLKRFHLSPRRRAVAVALGLWGVLLSACGGGGGGSDAGGGGVNPPPVAGPAVDISSIAAADPGSSLPADWQHGTFMQIFVRSYADSDGDGVGDLRGLTGKLDYLKDLGITGLWLMPITRSQDRDHGYATSDYRNIEAQYGSLADVDELLRQAHARGIGVIMDYVINHSSYENALFANSRIDASNPYRNWYLWQNPRPSGWNIYGNNPWYGNAAGYYFAAFWDQMPDWNLQNAAVIAYHHNNLRFWLNRGLDGFRFDAVGHLVENGPSQWNNQAQNYPLMRDVKTLVDSYAKRWMVCESPEDAAGFTAACGSAFAFGHHANVVRASKGDGAAVQSVANYFKTASANVANLLANHDSFAGQRLYDQFGGNQAQYKLAAATLLLQPGTPFLYYGEEIGMAGAASLSGDPKLRTPMSWTGNASNAGFTSGVPYRSLSANVASFNAQAQAGDPNSLHAFYKSMIGLRNSVPAIARGGFEGSVVVGSAHGFVRRLGNERAVVAINYGAGVTNIAMTGLPSGATLAAVWPAGGADLAVDASGAVTLPVDAQAVRVYTLR